MFETIVAGWVAIISVSHIPCYPSFDIQTVASPLSLACALESLFLIVLLTLLHLDRGPLVYVCFIQEFHEPWAYERIFFIIFLTIILSHFITFHLLCSLFYFFLFFYFVLFATYSTSSFFHPEWHSSQFFTWRMITPFPLSTLRTLI